MSVGLEVAVILTGIGVAAVAVANNARTVTPYSFLLAKVRAWEARLLTDAVIQSLAESPSLEALLSALRGTHYETDLESTDADVESIERMLDAYLASCYRNVLELLPKDASRFLERYAERIDLGNLKLVIEAVAGRVEREDAISHLRDGMLFSKDRLEVMARAETLEELVELLSYTSYYDDLKRQIEPGEYDVSDLLRAVEHCYYTSVWREAGNLGRRNRRMARLILGREIDLQNVKLILRLKRESVDPGLISKNLIPVEGELKHELLDLCSRADGVEEAAQILMRSRLKAVLTPILSQGTGDLGRIENLLDESLLNYSKSLSLFHPLTIATPLCFLQQIQAEVRNMRAVARGVADGVPADEVKELLLRSARVE